MDTPVQKRRRPRGDGNTAFECDVHSNGAGSRPVSKFPPTHGTMTRRKRTRPKKFDENKNNVIIGSFCLFATAVFLFLDFILPALTVVRLPKPNVDIPVPSADEWPLIHIVNTRFMQFQGSLTTLGRARLLQFLTFSLPSIIHQSTQQFFWIIKTDPEFTDTDVFREMIEAVQAYPNIYLVASNTNFLIHPDQRGSWRDGLEGIDLLSSKIYTGDIFKLKQAIALREERPVLETRLDADDGLHNLYLETLQTVAKERFADGSPNGMELKWLYWCPRMHIEWHPSHNSSASDEDPTDHPAGYLKPIRHSKLCITPGITAAYNVGVDSNDVPIQSHDVLYKAVHNSTACYSTPNTATYDESCLEFVEDPTVNAVRSRAWTSAGMMEIDVDDGQDSAMGQAWHILRVGFHIDKQMAEKTKKFLSENKRQIAYENLIGQCKGAHSCKDKAKDHLQKLVEDGRGDTGSSTGSAFDTTKKTGPLRQHSKSR